MTRRLYYLLLLILLTFSVTFEEAAAQFEGTISFRAYEPARPEKPNRTMEFIATPQRIFMRSEDYYRVFSGMDANGFLVRHDRDDFIFLSGDSEGLRIGREDVDNITRMIGYMQGGGGPGQSFDWDGRTEMTGETRIIHGYETEQIKVVEQDSENHIVVWLTEEIKINWGILQETWHQTMDMVVDVDLPVELFMNRNSFPLQIEYYENGRLTTLVESVEVNSAPVDRSLLEIPEGAEMIGITDLMMRMMRERR